jgi:hypothetical protein
MPNHQIVINLDTAEFTQLQRQAELAGFDSVDTFLQRKIAAQANVKDADNFFALESMAEKLRSLHLGLKLFVDETNDKYGFNESPVQSLYKVETEMPTAQQTPEADSLADYLHDQLEHLAEAAFSRTNGEKLKANSLHARVLDTPSSWDAFDQIDIRAEVDSLNNVDSEEDQEEAIELFGPSEKLVNLNDELAMASA